MKNDPEIIINQARLTITQGDITKMDTDAIVNAANSTLMGGGGVDGAIHRAGGPAILEECKDVVARQGQLPNGQAVITTGSKMKTRHVIHTVGPIWRGGDQREPELLASAYRESLGLAAANNLSSVAFPSISTGVYRYPVDEAARIALKTVAEFLQQSTSVREVVFVLFNDEAYQAYNGAMQEITRAQNQ
jgi:O-acetyl-ADP-ribose deacetylase (regulator of RNase III)